MKKAVFSNIREIVDYLNQMDNQPRAAMAFRTSVVENSFDLYLQAS